MSSQPDYEYTLTVPATPDRVWQAWTDADALRAWFAEHADVDPKPGGAYRFWGRFTLGTPNADEATQSLVELDQDKRLVFRWTWAGVPTEVELLLEAKEWKEFTMGSEPPTRPPQPGCALTVRQRFEGTMPYDKPEHLVDDHWRLVFGNLCGYLDDGFPISMPDYTDERPEVRLSVFIEAPPRAVFRTLTEPALLNRWIAMDAKVDAREGGEIDFGWGGCGEAESDGTGLKILELVPDQRLTLSWPDWRGQADEPDTRVSWELVAEGNGTRVEFAHTGFRRTADRSDYHQGWAGFLESLGRVAVSLAD